MTIRRSSSQFSKQRSKNRKVVPLGSLYKIER